MRRLAVVGVVVAALLAGACGGKDEPLGPTATVPQGTTTTNPYAVPAVIDEAYVNRVLAGLDQAVGDVTRLVVLNRTLPPEAIDRLRVIYVDDGLLQLVVDTYEHDLLSGLEGVRPNPGNRRTTVTELLTVKPRCIFAKVHTDVSAVALRSGAMVDQWVGLVPMETPPQSASMRLAGDLFTKASLATSQNRRTRATTTDPYTPAGTSPRRRR